MKNLISNGDCPVVLFIIDTLEVGGAEKSILEITARFKKYRPIVISIYEGSFLQIFYEEKRIEVISLNFHSKTNSSKILEKLQNVVYDLEPKIIHATLIRSCLLSRKLKNKKWYLINSLVNNTYSLQRYKTLSPWRSLKLLYIQFQDLKSAGKADLYFSNSQTIKDTTARALLLPKEKIKVVYRGREPEDFIGNKSQNLLDILELKGNTVFSCIGRLIKRKGQLDLVKAFSKYLQKHPDSILLLVGEGNLKEELIPLIQNLNIQNKVKLLGQRNDIPKILDLTNYFVFPSYYEGLPGALVEAMFSKTPIIASNIPENLECVSEETALIFRPGDVEGMVEKLERAIEDKDWDGRVNKAYAYALKNFSIAHIAVQYEEIYDQLLSR